MRLWFNLTIDDWRFDDFTIWHHGMCTIWILVIIIIIIIINEVVSRQWQLIFYQIKSTCSNLYLSTVGQCFLPVNFCHVWHLYWREKFRYLTHAQMIAWKQLCQTAKVWLEDVFLMNLWKPSFRFYMFCWELNLIAFTNFTWSLSHSLYSLYCPMVWGS